MEQPSWVPVNDLARGIAEDRAALDNAIADVLSSGYLVHGPHHAAFECALRDYVGARHALGVASGTDALEIALQAVMPPGRNTVITAANAGAYATVAARRDGFDVKYVDVLPSTLCLDPAAVLRDLDDTVGAVVVTHLYGRAADVPAVIAACRQYGVAVVEDCAQAIGARIGDHPVGSMGDAATFSFYPTKNLGALGDGGAITTQSDTIAERVRALRQYGWSAKYTISSVAGQNSRLDEIQAAFLAARMTRLDERNARRRDIVRRYREAASERVEVLDASGPEHVAHLAILRTPDRDELRSHFEAAQIRTDVHYPVPDHLQPAFRSRYSGLRLPVTEASAQEILTVPLFPELTEVEISRICDVLGKF